MSLKGYEQKQPLLKYLRAEGRNIPHLDDAYELWNADKNEYVIFAGEAERQKFGWSLYTTNLKIQIASYFLDKVKKLFMPQWLRMEPFMKENSKFDYFLKRYSYLGAFLVSIFAPLDSLASAIVAIQNFEHEGRKFNPKKCTFQKIKNLLHRIQQNNSKQKPNVIKKSALIIRVFQREQMFNDNNWYAQSINHRHLHTHVPHLFDTGMLSQNGELFLPRDASKNPADIISGLQEINKAIERGDIAEENRLRKQYLMSDPVHIWTEDLFNNCNRFIGDIFLALRKTYEPEIIKLCVQTN